MAEATLAAGTIPGVATVICDLGFELTRMPGDRSRLDMFEEERGCWRSRYRRGPA